MVPTTIYEDKDFVVINKPAGLPVHAGGSIKSGETLVDWLIKKYPEIKKVGDDLTVRPGIVHRLDKETSGVMVAARTQEGFDNLKQLFKSRMVEKKYLALVRGVINQKSGRINLPVGTLKSHGVKRTVRKDYGKQMKEAVTEFRVLEHFPDATLVEARPKTGRMHQIRAHFAALHHPIVGDRLYGGNKPSFFMKGLDKDLPAGLSRQFLHAGSLSFSYPGGRRFVFEASLPEDLKKFLASLRNSR